MYLQPLPVCVQQRDGVTVVGVEVLARRHAVRVAEGVVGEGALHGERRGEGHHGVDLQVQFNRHFGDVPDQIMFGVMTRAITE